MAKRKRIVLWVKWSRARRCWHVLRPADELGPNLPDEYDVKQEAVSAGVRACRKLRVAGKLAQLKVCNRNGRIAFERTYGADPRRTKG